MTTKLLVTGYSSFLTLILVLASACSHTALSPANRSTYLNQRGVNLAESGLWEEAHFYWQRAHELDPENPKILNNLAIWHEREGQISLAEKFYRKALTLEGNLEVVRANLEASLKMQQTVGRKDSGASNESK